MKLQTAAFVLPTKLSLFSLNCVAVLTGDCCSRTYGKDLRREGEPTDAEVPECHCIPCSTLLKSHCREIVPRDLPGPRISRPCMILGLVWPREDQAGGGEPEGQWETLEGRDIE